MAQIATERSESVAATVANPAPLGLSAFALTTFVLSSANTGLITAPNVVLGLALFYGGLVQLLAGIQEFKTGNTFGATAFCSYGGFWLAFAVLFIPPFAALTPYTKAADLHTALGYFLLGWAIFTFIMFLGTFRLNGALIAVFGLLFLTFLVLAIGEFTVNTSIHQIGGWIGFLTALAAWYAALADILAATKATFQLPKFPMS